MKSVLNTETNEVVGFDDNASDDFISNFFQNDKEGRPTADFNPTPYDVHVRPALEQAKITGNNEILYAARRRALDEDPFNKSLLHGITFGLTPDTTQEEKSVYGQETTIGNLGGQIASIIATSGLGSILGAGKLATAAGDSAEGLLPQGSTILKTGEMVWNNASQAVIGSSKVLAKTLGENVNKLTQGVVESSVLGAMYNGIIKTVEEGKKFLGDDDAGIKKQAPDLVNIGKSILNVSKSAATGALTWAPYGVGGVFIPKTAIGITTGTAAVTGTAYAISRAEGQSHTDSVLNAILIGTTHGILHANELTLENRKDIVEGFQNIIADYTKAKNGLTESNNIHQMVGDEFVKSEAQQVIDDQNADLLAAGEETKAKQAQADEAVSVQDEATQQNVEIDKANKIAAEEKLAGTFKDPYDPKMFDYLSQFIPSRYLVRMDGIERLRLANSKRNELVKYQESHQIIENEINTENARADNKLENDILLRRTQNNGIDEVITSDVLTKKLAVNIADKMLLIDKSKGENNEEAKAIRKEEVTIPVLKNTEDAINFGQANKDNPDILSELKRLREESVAKKSINNEGSSVAKASKDINKALVEKGFKELSEDEKAKFNSVNKQEQLDKVQELISDKEKSKRMALGKEPIPNDVHPQVLFNAVKNRAIEEVDGETLRDLANSPIAKERSLAAQTLGASGFNNGKFEADPIKIIQYLTKQKESKVERLSKDKKPDAIKKDIKKSLEEKINKLKPTKKDWSAFLDELAC